MINVSRLENLSTIESLVPATSTVNLRAKAHPRFEGRLSQLDTIRISDAKIKSVLVPLDGTHVAEQAIPLALGIAEQSGAMLNLVHVIVPAEVLDPYTVPHFADGLLKSLKQDKMQYLKGIREQIAASSSALVASHVISGPAIPTTLNELTGADADLVVMATHGRGILGRFWSGSVAHSWLQRMSVPTIVVRGSHSPGMIRAQRPNHILLPLEGSETSETAIRSIIDLGLFPAARHSLLQIVPLVPQRVVREYGLGTEWVPSWHHWSEGMQQLHPSARCLRNDDRRVHTKIVSSNEPFGQVVLGYSERNDVELIAVAHRPQQLLGRLLWPNLSEYLFRNSSRPIMFVPNERP